jgi:LDH2 family malate/lactate/ureidoglycolate dehydrogenase
MTSSFSSERWREWASTVLEKAGLPSEAAEVVAQGLVEGDLYGHSTHGLALLPGYVEELQNGAMERVGRPEVVSDAGAIALWDARRLPGIWTTQLAMQEAMRRADAFGVGGVSIRRSHHIGCLAIFLEEPARQGYLVMVLSSDPSDAHVAPFGGRTPIMTPNPIAAGIPAEPDPILIDVSTSITTAGMTGRLQKTGERFPGPWLLDSEGRTTNDPNALAAGGSLQLVGGQDHGHKGFGLSLLVEALTQGLAGFGRADRPTEWGAGVLVLAFAPSRLAGADAFLRQTTWLAEACLASPPIDPAKPVRMPGQLAQARKEAAIRKGLMFPPVVLESLKSLASKIGLPLPQ